ncbi:MAG TPA: M1 family metallopeptidase [Saprospiraceae bacterium]|nr:M1 family metallopeptidase [Saprospiraceae bacterium]
MEGRKMTWICLGICILNGYLNPVVAQPSKFYWQQKITYAMTVTMDVRSNRFDAHQSITYKNNSPDALTRLYFHLYFNAFQPGSEMDIRSQTIPDPDPRIGSRISNLSEEEQGFQKITKLQQGGRDLKYNVKGTILEVFPSQPIQPGQSIKLEMDYTAQVPLQIRRSGRDNAEGIRYSMSQWYPKMCEYDHLGWHTDPYIGREFYGVWGDFAVEITIDSSYTIGGTGLLKNAKQIGHGYGGKSKHPDRLTTWQFEAKNVHDFVWAADPDYVHNIHHCKNGVVFHMYYQPSETNNRNWKKLPSIMEEALNYANEHFGVYPYSQFSFIQAGDGGMEYPMATLITGNRPLGSLVGVAVHEFLHAWYYNTLGFNESLYYWMDEGFTNYAELRVIDHLKAKGIIPGEPDEFLYDSDFKSYYTIFTRGIEESLSTHADHFEYNSAYGFAAYNKGSIFLHQLEYVIGSDPFNKGLLEFYNTWKFKHPDADDLLKIMEKNSGLQLDWYKEYMVYTTKTIDYAIDSLMDIQDHTWIHLVNYGKMPMPLDMEVKMLDGTSSFYTIPLDLMLGSKKQADPSGKAYTVLPAWDWVNPEYLFNLPFGVSKIKEIIIDPLHRMADQDRNNNVWPRMEEETKE